MPQLLKTVHSRVKQHTESKFAVIFALRPFQTYNLSMLVSLHSSRKCAGNLRLINGDVKRDAIRHNHGLVVQQNGFYSNHAETKKFSCEPCRPIWIELGTRHVPCYGGYVPASDVYSSRIAPNIMSINPLMNLYKFTCQYCLSLSSISELNLKSMCRQMPVVSSLLSFYLPNKLMPKA